jgi:hypothetical protein
MTAVVAAGLALTACSRETPPPPRADWACACAKGKTMVTIRTDRIDTSFNAVEIAAVVAAHL